MDLPDNLLDDFDFNVDDDNDEEVITSCNKVRLEFSVKFLTKSKILDSFFLPNR